MFLNSDLCGISQNSETEMILKSRWVTMPNYSVGLVHRFTEVLNQYQKSCDPMG